MLEEAEVFFLFPPLWGEQEQCVLVQTSANAAQYWCLFAAVRWRGRQADRWTGSVDKQPGQQENETKQNSCTPYATESPPPPPLHQTNTLGSVAKTKVSDTCSCTYIDNDTTILSHWAFKDPSVRLDISMQNEDPEEQTGISFSVAFCHVG